MGPYKVKENNKIKNNINLNSAIIPNQNAFLKRNIHPINVININNNNDNHTNKIIINNQNMQQQPIINNYYSINTNNQSNAPVKVINVYNQN